MREHIYAGINHLDPPAPRRKARPRPGCRHVTVGWVQVPHPRYGRRHPHYRRFEMITPCTCKGATS